MSTMETQLTALELEHLWSLDRIALNDCEDMFLQLVSKRTNTPLKGEGRPLGDWEAPLAIAGWRWAEGHDSGRFAHNANVADMRVSDVAIVRTVDAASPLVARLCASGDLLSSATVRCLKAAGERNTSQIEYLNLRLEDSFVRNYQIYTSSRANRLMEAFQLSAHKIKIVYATQKETGARGAEVVFTLDIANRKVA